MPYTKAQLEVIMSGLPTLDVWRKTVLLVERMHATNAAAVAAGQQALARVAELEADLVRANARRDDWEKAYEREKEWREGADARVAELEKLLAERNAQVVLFSEGLGRIAVGDLGGKEAHDLARALLAKVPT